MSSIGPWQLLILLLVVLLVFGTKKLRSLGTDLGGAVRDFRKGIRESEDEAPESSQEASRDEPGAPSESGPGSGPSRPSSN